MDEMEFATLFFGLLFSALLRMWQYPEPLDKRIALISAMSRAHGGELAHQISSASGTAPIGIRGVTRLHNPPA
jgi:hypothetical protein